MRQAVETLYSQALEAGIEVLLDDRDERPGVKFADADLLGIPHRIVVGDRGLQNQVVEYRGRKDQEIKEVPLTAALGLVTGA